MKTECRECTSDVGSMVCARSGQFVAHAALTGMVHMVPGRVIDKTGRTEFVGLYDNMLRQ
jgi:hypothetical protein